MSAVEPSCEFRLPEVRKRNPLAVTAHDTLVLARRNLMRIPRQPDLLIAYTIQPVMFVLLFVYVFGGAISTPGFDYVDFLMPGIIVQSIAFGGFVTALGLSEDVKKGLIDRFRSLPMSRAAVLAGRTFSDIVLNCLSLVVLFAVGFAAGFNFQDTTAGQVVLGLVLMLLLGYSFSWIFALVGLYSNSPETANSIGFTLIFPLTFASAIFVPAESMPDGLQQIAEANPFTTVVDAVRSLWLGTPANSDVWMAFVWCAVLLGVFAPLAASRYKQVAAK
jgi:ABC transporter DrrB family efflux protein